MAGLAVALVTLQALDQRAQKHLVKAQLTFGRDLFEQRRADAQHRNGIVGLDRRRAFRIDDITRLAEAIPGIERADELAVGLDPDATGHDDVETVIDLTLPGNGLPGRKFAPLTGAQQVPDFSLGKIVEEAQATQQVEMLLVIDALILLLQALVALRQGTGQFPAAGLSLGRVFLQSGRSDILEFRRHLRPERVYRRRRSVNNLVQQPRQRAGAERAKPGHQLVHHGAE